MRQQNGVDMTLEVVDGNEGLVQGECQRLGVGHPDQERTRQARAFGDRDRVEIGEADAGLGYRRARTTGTILRRCSREASSGTTPP